MMSSPRLPTPRPCTPRVPSATVLGWVPTDMWPGSVALSPLLHVPQIRRSMIDGNDGQRFIKTLIKSLDEVTMQGKGPKLPLR